MKPNPTREFEGAEANPLKIFVRQIAPPSNGPGELRCGPRRQNYWRPPKCSDYAPLPDGRRLNFLHAVEAAPARSSRDRLVDEFVSRAVEVSPRFRHADPFAAQPSEPFEAGAGRDAGSVPLPNVRLAGSIGRQLRGSSCFRNCRHSVLCVIASRIAADLVPKTRFRLRRPNTAARRRL